MRGENLPDTVDDHVNTSYRVGSASATSAQYDLAAINHVPDTPSVEIPVITAYYSDVVTEEPEPLSIFREPTLNTHSSDEPDHEQAGSGLSRKPRRRPTPYPISLQPLTEGALKAFDVFHGACREDNPADISSTVAQPAASSRSSSVQDSIMARRQMNDNQVPATVLPVVERSESFRSDSESRRVTVLSRGSQSTGSTNSSSMFSQWDDASRSDTSASQQASQ